MHDAIQFLSGRLHRVLASSCRVSAVACLVGGLVLSQGLIPWPVSAQEFTPRMTPQQVAANPAERKRDFSRGVFGGNANLIADVAEEVAPSVVNIDVERSRQVAPGVGAPGFPFNEDFMKRFFGFEMGPSPFRTFPGPNNSAPPPSRVVTGNGSGVVVDKAGHILTNNHVVASADKITVTLTDGRKFPASVVGRDRFTDLAVLKIEAQNLRPAAMGRSEKLRPGEWVLAIGSPLGFDHTVTLGIISGISRRVPDINMNVEFIQTDAAINPGNSGGPLVNLRGEVVGINTAISGTAQNIGFAIPVDVVKHVTESLIAHGQITRPWIGLAMAEITPEFAKSLGLQEDLQGVVVSQVIPNSPSSTAGFRQGDIIQRVDGQFVKEPKVIQDMVRTRPLNTPLNFQILRNGQMMALSVQTDMLPDQDLPNQPTPPQGRMLPFGVPGR